VENPPIICVKQSNTKTADSRHHFLFLVIPAFIDEKIINAKIKRGSSSHWMFPRSFFQRVYYLIHCVVPSILTFDSAPFPHHFGVEMHEFMWNYNEVKVSRTLIFYGFSAFLYISYYTIFTSKRIQHSYLV
jgi:hypothetical protein